MANHHLYNPSSYEPSSTTPKLSSSIYTSRALIDPSIYSSSARYLTSASEYPNYSDPSMYYGAYSSAAAWPEYEASAAAGLKRSSEAIYNQTVLGANNMYGQSEGWLSAEYLAKRPRIESGAHLPIYPQRPGEKDCAHYMQTRTCKFGDTCRFDHPIWVPDGGIPEWKEAPVFTNEEVHPERPGEPDCPYFVKTQRCMYGLKCKFNHPKAKTGPLDAAKIVDVNSLPERPSEPPCVFYLKTGTCKFGVTCKFNHPKDIHIPSSVQENGSGEQTESAATGEGSIGVLGLVNAPALVTPAQLHNSKGLPIRMGEVDCPFYLKTGSCKYGATCRYNHPDIFGLNPPSAALSHTFGISPAASLNIGVPGTFGHQVLDPRLVPTTLGLGSTIYPQRPGQMECDFYMKTGVCKFGETCRFNHPIDRTAPPANAEENVKLTLAGFPRREGAILCPYYLKTGTCKYGPTCRFDHPPPGEVMAMATSQGTTTAAGEEEKGDEENEEQ